MTPDERRHYLRMAGTPITLLALVILIAVAIRAGWKAVSAPVPPPPITPCVNQDVKGKLTTKDVTVSVYNSGHTRGLAGSVSKQLANVGFVIDSVANREPMVKGVTVRELRLPRNCVVSLIIRGDRSFAPRAETKLEQGDELLIVVPQGQRRYVVERLTEIGRGGRLARWHGLRVQAE